MVVFADKQQLVEDPYLRLEDAAPQQSQDLVAIFLEQVNFFTYI